MRLPMGEEMGKENGLFRVAIIAAAWNNPDMSPVGHKKFSLPGTFFEQLNYEYSKHVGRKYSQIL